MLRLRYSLLPLVCLLPPLLAAQEAPIRLRLDTGEAEAALAVLDARAASGVVADSLWSQLEGTEGYVRLAERERTMGREFSTADFRAYLLGDSLLGRRELLRRTLEAWSAMPVSGAGARALAYLPPGTPIAATVYILIKPRPNSFVYDLGGRPAIMLFLDPDESPASFVNVAAHELHHIGQAAACRAVAQKTPIDTSAGARKARDWLSAFGEGLAMLAAAGGPEVHPHVDSPAADRERWDRDMADAAPQMRELESFFLDLLEGRLTDEAGITRRGMQFFGVQGPWYTVGYRMWSTVERSYGRRRVIDDVCEPARLLLDYNAAVAGVPEAPRWSPRFTARLRTLVPELAGAGSAEAQRP
jgi:Putative zinc dependent peptidase (DUF5700)